MNREQALPFIIILLYFVVTMIIGILPYGRKRVKTIADFHSASAAIGSVATILCVLAALYSSSTWTGWVSLTSEHGVFASYAIAYIAATGILYCLISPNVYLIGRQKGLMTLGQFLEALYGDRRIKYLVGLISFFAGCLWIIMEITTLGFVVYTAFESKLDMSYCLLLGLLIVLVYILWGGLESAIWTDCFQGSVMIIGGIVLVVYLVNSYFSSFAALGESLAPHREMLTISRDYSTGGEYTLFQWLSYVVLGSVGCICLPQIFPRMFLGKSVHIQKKVGIVISLSAIWCLTFIIIGFISFLIIPAGEYETAIFVLSRLTDNTYLLSLAYIVLIAASMGTLDITLLSMSTILTTDFLQSSFQRRGIVVSQTNYLKVSRICIIVVSALCLFVSIVYDQSIINLAFFSYEFIAQLFPLLIYGLYWPGKRANVALAALFSGTLFTACARLLPLPLGIAGGTYGLVINCLVLVLGMLCSRDESSSSQE